MHFQKINDNKLKVIVNSSDLIEKNIDVDSFLANSEKSQDFFFEILDMAENNYSFSIENNKAIVEAISLDNDVFMITITKIVSDNSPSSTNLCSIFIFNSLKNIFELYYSCIMQNIDFKKFYIYYFLDSYYVVLYEKDSKLQDILYEYSFCKLQKDITNILLEHGKRVNLK